MNKETFKSLIKEKIFSQASSTSPIKILKVKKIWNRNHDVLRNQKMFHQNLPLRVQMEL